MTTPPQAPHPLGPVVAAHLAAANVTANRAATEAHIPPSTLTRRLSGASPFRADELARLAALLEVPASALVAEAERAA